MRAPPHLRPPPPVDQYERVKGRKDNKKGGEETRLGAFFFSSSRCQVTTVLLKVEAAGFLS